MKSQAIPTIKSLADELGLSKATVSKALNGRADVAANTRQQVLSLAHTTGYRLHAKHWVRTIGLVMSPGQGLDHPTLSDFLVGTSQILEERGFDLLVSHAQSEDDTETYQRLVDAGKVDGFVLMRTQVQDPRVQWLLNNRVPFVTHGRSQWSQRHAWFDLDGEWAARLAFEHLQDLGHKTIAYIAAPEKYFFSINRLAGAGPYASQVVEASNSERGGFMAAAQIFSQKKLPAPTAIVCALDSQAIGVYHWLREQGLKLGQDVSVVGYDDIPVASALRPKLSTFAQSGIHAGRQVGQMLLDLLGGTPAQHLQLLERPEPKFRGSSARPARSSSELGQLLGKSAQSSLGENKNDY